MYRRWGMGRKGGVGEGGGGCGGDTSGLSVVAGSKITIVAGRVPEPCRPFPLHKLTHVTNIAREIK